MARPTHQLLIRFASARRKSCALPTWWFWRGGCTRSHSEHGRETPQRRWYFVLRRGRVGRCQVCKAQDKIRKTKITFSSSLGPAETRAALKRPFCFAKLGTDKQRDFASGKTRNKRINRKAVYRDGAGWSSPVARQAHNLKAAGSNPAPATKSKKARMEKSSGLFDV